MKTLVSLIRHGETEWNIQGRFQGCRDIRLTDNGRAQAEYLKSRFKDNYDYIYTSPLGRAFETAKIVASVKGVEPILLDELREINFGEWEGLRISDIEENYPDEFIRWRTDREEAKICGGDLSIRNTAIRAKKGILDVVKNHQGKRILIIAHGGIIKAGLIGLFDWDMTMYHKMVMGNTAVTDISFNLDLHPVLMFYNDMSHLPAKAEDKTFG